MVCWGVSWGGSIGGGGGGCRGRAAAFSVVEPSDVTWRVSASGSVVIVTRASSRHRTGNEAPNARVQALWECSGALLFFHHPPSRCARKEFLSAYLEILQ